MLKKMQIGPENAKNAKRAPECRKMQIKVKNANKPYLHNLDITSD